LHWRASLVTLLVLALAGTAHALDTLDNADWKESAVPDAPGFRTDQLLTLDMPTHISLRFGIDPNTLTITPEGVVRYVVVATNSSGGVTAMFEGIRCTTGEVRVYARTNGTQAWKMVKDAPWRSLYDTNPSRHAVMFARQGACDNGAPTSYSADGIIRAMKKRG